MEGSLFHETFGDKPQGIGGETAAGTARAEAGLLAAKRAGILREIEVWTIAC